MLALSIRQPWAELILRGIKTVEYRSRPTRVIGERFWIYAALGSATKRRSDVIERNMFAAEYLSWELPPLLIDIRAPREHDAKHIVGSEHIPLNHLAEHLEKLPIDRPLLVYCAGGYRSSIAASLLQSRGFPLVSEIAGGIAGWEAAKLPIQSATVG